VRTLFTGALAEMRQAFRRLEVQVPPPQAVPFRDGFVYRHVEKTIQQALIQKLARIVSGLHAVDVLLINGFVQEQSVLNRTLDELGEDVAFLAAAITNDAITDLHKQYLTAFFDEEFDDLENIINSTQKRNYPRRRKIRAYVTRVLGGEKVNSSHTLDVGETISKTYSGYVHAASPHIMDMCGGDPPRFHVSGMNGTPRIGEHVRDAWNYFYRGLIDTTAVAKALGDAKLVDHLYRYIGEFESASGTNFGGRAKAET
jgi:hypothetical protein